MSAFIVLMMVALGQFGYGKVANREDKDEEPFKPFLFGGISSLDQIAQKIGTISKAIGSDVSSQQILSTFPDSLDRTRPIGLFGFWELVEKPIGEQSLEPILLIPTKDAKALLTHFRDRWLIDQLELKDGIWNFHASFFACSAIERNEWLIVAASQDVNFKKIPLDLDKSFVPYKEKYDLFVSFLPMQCPPSLRDKMLEVLKRPIESSSPFGDQPIDVVETGAVFDREIRANVTSWLESTKECTLGAKLPETNGKLVLEFNTLIEPGSNVARDFAQLTESPSLFSKFGMERESSRTSWKLRLPKFFADYSVARYKYDAVRLKEDSDKAESELGLSSESKERIFDEVSAMIIATLESRNLDLLFFADEKQSNTIALVRAGESHRMEAILKELQKSLQTRPELGQVELNVDKHKGVAIHAIVIKTKELPNKPIMSDRTLPEEIRIGIGVSKEVVMVVTGESPVTELKKALDNTQKANYGKKNNDAFYSSEISVSKFPVGDFPFSLCAEIPKPKLNDRLVMELRSVPNGLTGRMTIELGAIDWFVNSFPTIIQNQIAAAKKTPVPPPTKSKGLVDSPTPSMPERHTPSKPSLPEQSSPSSKFKISGAKPQEAQSQNKYTEIAKFTDLTWGVLGMDFSPDGKFLAAGKIDQMVVILNIRNKSHAGSKEKLSKLRTAQECAFTPDGRKLLVGGQSGLVQVFSFVKNGMLKEIAEFSGHSSEIKCLSISDDGKFALSGDQGKKVFYWDIGTGGMVASITGFDGPVKAVHLPPKTRIAYATDGSNLVQFDLAKKAIIREMKLTDSWASGQAAAFSSNGEFVAVGDTYDIRIWNLATGEELPRLKQKEIQWAMQFTPDAQTLISGGTGKVNIWDVRDSKLRSAQFIGDFGYIKSVAISRDGKQVGVSFQNQVNVFQLK